MFRKVTFFPEIYLIKIIIFYIVLEFQILLYHVMRCNVIICVQQ